MFDKRAGSGSAKSPSSVGVLHGGVPGFSVSGVSLVEMLVAVALLSLVSIAALQLVRMTKNTMVGAEGTISQQQRSEAIAAYIYKDFALGNLRDDVRSQVYRNSDMPDDLRGGMGMTFVSLFGQTSRMKGTGPRCPLTEATDPANAVFKLNTDCIMPGGESIIVHINRLLKNGIKITTGLEGGAGRCSISKPVEIDQLTGIATVTVDDPSCLASGADTSTGVAAGSQVLLPRYVAYNTGNPEVFHTSMIEPPDSATKGVGLDMPDQHIVQGGGTLNLTDFVYALANDFETEVTVKLETEKPLSRLEIGVVPAAVTVVKPKPNSVELSGKVSAVRQALLTLNYASADSYFGTDLLKGAISDGSLRSEAQTNLDVRANCGGQKNGTALLFELGHNNSNGGFTPVSYVTSVSVEGKKLPVEYYGYCGPQGGEVIKFDRPDGYYTTFQAGDNMTDFCANAKRELRWNGDDIDPANFNLGGFPYVRSGPMYRPGYAKRDHVSVYLYENFMDSPPPANPSVNSGDATTLNRYSLIFQFDTFDNTSGSVRFQLDNIEAGRDPESVIANIAVGKGMSGAADSTRKTRSRPLASTRSTKRLELCAIESNALAAPAQCSDKFKAAYVAIDGYMQGYHGRLDIQHARWTAVGNTYQATGLPNLPPEIVATWYPEFGVLKYSSTVSHKNKIWSRAMAQTLYRPTGRSSDASLTFNISLGRLAFFEGGVDRYYDFVPAAAALPPDNGTPARLTFDLALAHAGQPDPANCGLEGYLVNVGSESEQDHLRRVMMTAETPGWQSGWIGAQIDPSASYTYKWLTGAPAEQKHFWYSDGVNGLPFQALYHRRETSKNVRAFYEFDRSPLVTNRLQNLVQSLSGVAYRYTNWAAGNDVRTCDPAKGNVPVAGFCEPVSSNRGDAVAIYGHKDRDGTWFSVRDGQYACDANNDDSICGYYLELQKPAGGQPLGLARQVTRDMSRFREFCQGADNGTG